MKSTYKKKNYKKKTVSKSLNSAQKKEVKKLIGNQLENKYVDVAQQYTALVYGGQTTALTTGIAQDVTVGGRVGDKVSLKNITINICTQHTPAAIGTDVVSYCRGILFKWRINTAVSAPSTVLAVLKVAGAAGSTSAGIMAQYARTNKNDADFTILWDRTWSAADSAITPVQKIRIYKRLGSVTFTPAATTAEGHLYLLLISDNIGTGAPQPLVSFSSRVEYEDA